MTVAGFRHARGVRTLSVVLIALLLAPATGRANDVTPPLPAPPRTPVVGFIDTHLHQFANLGFGGEEVWASPMDPALDASAPLGVARARALPNSDYLYVSDADAADYLAPGNIPVTTTPAATSCDSGSCWPQCPTGTGISGNACWRITIHGSDSSGDLLNQVIPNGSSSHGVIGYPDMNGWPAWDVLTTQQAYWEWLQRAHDNGLKMIVMLAVNNSVLCQLEVHRASFNCADDGAVARQIQGAKDLENYIDARAGGAGLGFYHIVYSSAEARQAIANGKLAVVLGTEVDTEWGCTTDSLTCTDSFVQTQVQNYYNDGIRVVYPLHVINNAFGGTAAYTGLFEVDNYVVNGHWFDLVTCGSPIEWRSDIRQLLSDAKTAVDLAIASIIVIGPGALIALAAAVDVLIHSVSMLQILVPVLKVLLPSVSTVLDLGGPGLLAVAVALVEDAPGAVGSAPDGNCNNRGLTSVGATLVNSLMDHGMIIDVDHTDGTTFDSILSIAESRHYPGIVSGHTGLVGSSLTGTEVTAMGETFDPSESGRHEGNKTDAQVQRILNLGGFVSIGLTHGPRDKTRDYSSSDGVPFDCGKSSEAFAQVYLYATKHLGLSAIGIGSDMNGFAGLPAPRFGSKACGGDYDSSYDPNSTSGRIDYTTATNYDGLPLSQYSFGNRTWDYNVDGFAHVGMYPDFIADLGNLNVSHADLAPLFNGAEAYVRMWEKVDDHQPPTVRCGTVGENWHAADVTVPCIAFDTGYGLANVADASFSLSTSVPDGTETGNAATGTHPPICDQAGQCTGAVPAITGINVDKKDPTVVVTTPAAATPTYTLNQVVAADYACSDGGSGVATCAGPVASGASIDTTIGSHPFTVTGIDGVGHTVIVAHPYSVSFAICLLYDDTKASRAGSTVPVKLSLCDVNHTNVSSSAITLTATGLTLISTSAPGVLEDAGNANPDNEFRYDASLGGYIYNLKTTGLGTGTWALTFTATGDPNPHNVQFQIK